MSTRTVFVLDNNLFLRPRLESDLAGQGWTVRYAATAERYRALLADETPALVFVNVAAQGLAWPELVAETRREHPGMPVVGFGPHVDEALAARARAAGCVDVVPNGMVARSASRVAERHAAPSADGE